MIKAKGRLENAALNTIWAIISQGAITVLGLVSRKIFLSYLGAELLGVNSLFSDVLMLFSFADLGFGTAIMFSMYKPIANDDEERVKSLLLYYRKIYNFVIGGLIVISFGFLPFLNSLKTDIPVNDLRVYYLFFQINNIVEYVWAYRESYVIASQQERKLSIINLMYNIAKNIAQILVVIFWENFILYLVIGVVCGIAKKVLVNGYIINKYPITKLEGAVELNRTEKKNVLSKSTALLITKIGNLIINQTDSLIVSYMINVTQWGLASNYLMLKRSVFTVTDKIYSAVLPSMGNLTAEGNRNKILDAFLQYDFINAWIHTFCFVSLACLSSPFVSIFFGEKALLSNTFVFVFFLAAFIDGLRAPVSVLREACGYYETDKWFTVVAAVVNIVTSIPFAKVWGLSGVYVGTICAMIVLHICRTMVVFGNDNYAMTSYRYIYVMTKHIVVGIGLFVICMMFVSSTAKMVENRYMSFVLMCLEMVLIPNLLWIIIYARNKCFINLINIVKRRLGMKIRK